MKVLGKAFLALLVATGLFAQYRTGFSGAAPRMTGSFGNVVFPGGTAAMPGVQRSFGNVVFPGGGGPQLIFPNRITDPTAGLRPGAGLLGGSAARGRSSGVAYAYPVYVGGSYDSSYLYPAEQPSAQAPPPQNVTVVYPPAAAPIMISPSGGGDAQALGERSAFRLYQPAPSRPAEESAVPPAEQTHYLLAFKDRTIYSTPAYWVDGDTIHYFTAGNKHNQASVSLIDRELTGRLNEESGVEVKLPAGK
jgi:hypothetical protein